MLLLALVTFIFSLEQGANCEWPAEVHVNGHTLHTLRDCFQSRLLVSQIIHILWLHCRKVRAGIWLGRRKGAQQHGLQMHTSPMAIRTYFLLHMSRERKGGPVVTLLAWNVATDLHCDGVCFSRDLGKLIKTLQTYIPWKCFPLISPCFSSLSERWLSKIFCHAGDMWKISGLR